MRDIQTTLDTLLPARPTADYAAISWDQLRRLDPQLVDIGSHTCSHPILSRCTPEQIDGELRDSKTRIEQEMGRPVTAFCYPNGQRADYTTLVTEAVKTAGYESGVVAYGTFVRPGADPFLIERVNPRTKLSEFRNLLDGFAHLRSFGDRWQRTDWSSHPAALRVRGLARHDESI